MVKRTTVLLDDDVYELLVKEAIKRYGSVRALSKVINEVLREGLSSAEDEVLQLIYSEKIVSINEEEFEKFRREISRRLEER